MTQASRKPNSERQHHKYALKLEARDKRYLFASLGLHVLVAIVLFSSWEFTEAGKVKPLPSSIQARVLTAEELNQLKAKKVAEQKAKDDLKRAEKKKEQERLKVKKKKEAERKKKEAAKRKAEAKKKEEARKKALVQKKEKEKKEREKKEREQKAKKEKAKKEKARKEAEQKRKLEEQQEALKRKEREQSLADRLKALDEKAARDKEAQDQLRMQELLAEKNRAALALELSEVEKYKSLIYSRIVSRWHVPPHVKNLRVELQIKLLPTGELVTAKITKRSGNTAFDQSALNAAQSLRRYPVPSTAATFDKHFRQFSMGFTPPSE